MPVHALLGVYVIAAAVISSFSVADDSVRRYDQVLDTNDGMIDMLIHQENLAALYQPEAAPQPAPRVIAAGPPSASDPSAPARQPTAAQQPQAKPPRQQPGPTVPPNLTQGLSANLLGLLHEEPSND